MGETGVSIIRVGQEGGGERILGGQSGASGKGIEGKESSAQGPATVPISAARSEMRGCGPSYNEAIRTRGVNVCSDQCGGGTARIQCGEEVRDPAALSTRGGVG